MHDVVNSAEPVRFGKLILPSRWLLSPLAGYTNLPFRLAVRELGGLGLATTDLVNARALLRGSDRTMELIDTNADDHPLAVQIYGTDPAEMSAAAQWLENYGISVVDINMGCPVHKVTRGGGGSALMCDAGKSIELVRSVVEAVKIPVTVKMRLGWDDATLSAPFFSREFEKVGVGAVIIHGRTRAQGFGGTVSLAGIRAVVEAVERIPVVGNGDVRSIADAANMRKETGCAAVSIGRGALLNPWIFCQLCQWERTTDPGDPPTSRQRLQFMHKHFHLLVRQRGERFACLTFRKVANWYCKVVRPGRQVQQSLIRLERVADFEDIVNRLLETEPSALYDLTEASIPVPSGPMSHW
jgi:tRNA-dihydrouridine synthase B